MEVKAKSIKDLRSLTLLFNFPDQRPHTRSKPGHLLSNIIGYEGPGSLFSYLKVTKNWVDTICVDVDQINAGTHVFVISMALTKEGLGISPA